MPSVSGPSSARRLLSAALALCAAGRAAGYPQNLACGRELEAYGAPIMGHKPFRSAREISVIREDGTALTSGDSYTPGEMLTVTMNAYGGKEQMRASGGALWEAEYATEKRRCQMESDRKTCVNSEFATLCTDGAKGDIAIWAGHALGPENPGVGVTYKFVLKEQVAGEKPPPEAPRAPPPPPTPSPPPPGPSPPPFAKAPPAADTHVWPWQKPGYQPRKRNQKLKLSDQLENTALGGSVYAAAPGGSVSATRPLEGGSVENTGLGGSLYAAALADAAPRPLEGGSVSAARPLEGGGSVRAAQRVSGDGGSRPRGATASSGGAPAERSAAVGVLLGAAGGGLASALGIVLLRRCRGGAQS